MCTIFSAYRHNNAQKSNVSPWKGDAESDLLLCQTNLHSRSGNSSLYFGERSAGDSSRDRLRHILLFGTLCFSKDFVAQFLL